MAKLLVLLSLLLVGVVKADDWDVIATGLGKLQGVSFFDANNGLAVGWQKIYRTADAGATWTEATISSSPHTERYMDISVYDNYVSVVGYGDSSFLPGSSYSTDSGATFYKTDETHLREKWYTVEPIPGHSGSFVKAGEWTDALKRGSGAAISGNGGRSWTDCAWSSGTSWDLGQSTAVGVSFVSSSTGWLAGGESPFILNTTLWRATLAMTSNGGIDWTILQDIYDNYFYTAVDFVSETTGWLVAVSNNASTILKTTDGGVSWIKQASFDQCHLKAMKMFDENEGWAVGGYEDGAFYHGQLMHTTDGGVSWMAFSKRGYIINNVDGFDTAHVYASALDETEGGAVLQWVVGK